MIEIGSSDEPVKKCGGGKRELGRDFKKKKTAQLFHCFEAKTTPSIRLYFVEANVSMGLPFSNTELIFY